MSKYFDSHSRTFMEPQIVENGNHMVMTNVYSDTKKKYVNIDTKFQEEYNQGTCLSTNVLYADSASELYVANVPPMKRMMADVQYKFPQAITNVKSMKVINAEIPISYHNFSSQKGNTFFVVENLSDNRRFLSMIPDGNYDMTNLTDIIEKQHDTSNSNNITFIDGDYVGTIGQNIVHQDPPSIQIFIDEFSKKTKIRLTANASSKGYRIHFNVDAKGQVDKYNLKSKLGWALGFREPVYEIIQRDHPDILLTDFTINSSNTVDYIESEGIVNLSPFSYMYLAIDEFSHSKPNSFITPNYDSLMNSNIIARISLDAHNTSPTVYASTGNGKMVSETRTYQGKTDIQRLRIKLLDDFGKVIDLNHMDFSFVLEIEYQ